MKKICIEDLKPYEAPKHFKMTAMRLIGKEETDTQKYWIGLSHFLPGGGADMDAAPLERTYIVLDGEITVRNKNEEHLLGPLDTLFMAPGEEREVINETNMPVSMLVVYNYPA